MTLQIYNTLTKKKEVFKPMKKGAIDMFVCGPTTYGLVHIGNAKTYTQFDMIVKYLRQRTFDVKYVQNITDIDDKIINKAKEVKKEPLVLSEEFTEDYMKDMENIGNDAVSEYLKATDHIPEIISQVERLLQGNTAYQIDDGIYFDLSKDTDYGKLSGRTSVKEEDATSRIDHSEEKRQRGDFCLWKFAKDGEISWDAPFGKGRPGWHIEDTAITEKVFGPQYDIHGGAVDLIFPHHEAEIAQMESISGKKPLVNYWMHTGFLRMKKAKMSKSVGNIITLRDAVDKWGKETVRFLFLSSHYRNSLEFSEEIVDQAKNGLERINVYIQTLDKKDDHDLLKKKKEAFYAAMDDDFNTPNAFAILFDLVSIGNKEQIGGPETKAFFKEINEIFDMFTFEQNIPEAIITLADERESARKEKNWKRSDELRDTILKKGFIIEDKADGYNLKKAV